MDKKMKKAFGFWPLAFGSWQLAVGSLTYHDFG